MSFYITYIQVKISMINRQLNKTLCGIHKVLCDVYKLYMCIQNKYTVYMCINILYIHVYSIFICIHMYTEYLYYNYLKILTVSGSVIFFSSKTLTLSPFLCVICINFDVTGSHINSKKQH